MVSLTCGDDDHDDDDDIYYDAVFVCVSVTNHHFPNLS